MVLRSRVRFLVVVCSLVWAANQKKTSSQFLVVRGREDELILLIEYMFLEGVEEWNLGSNQIRLDQSCDSNNSKWNSKIIPPSLQGTSLKSWVPNHVHYLVTIPNRLDVSFYLILVLQIVQITNGCYRPFVTWQNFTRHPLNDSSQSYGISRWFYRLSVTHVNIIQ